ncbi:MAG: CRISPR-associated endoribonuclease Cas6 [Victivallaceae bacterium]|nr:CRISPR-associated endoribonuclease Cas6 [Victivallaceae bacterium]
MQIEITLAPNEASMLSFDYLHGLHSALMHCLTSVQPELAGELHDGEHRNRLKLFTFSPLSSSPKPQLVQLENESRKKMLLGKRVWFRIASPWPELLNALGEGLLRIGNLSINGKSFKVTRVTMVAPPEFSESMVWRPFGQSGSICTSWTPRDSERKSYIYPDKTETGTPACAQLLTDNLIHKWQRLQEIRPDLTDAWLKDAGDGKAPAVEDVQVEFIPIDAKRPYRTMMHCVKNTAIKSWRCPVCVKAPLPLQRLIWSSGLGEQNSQGYGLVQEGKQC